MFQDIDERVIERSECEQRNESKLILNHPLLNEMYELYTRYAFELMLNEYMKSHEYNVSRLGAESGRKICIEVQQGVYAVKDPSEQLKYEVKIRCKKLYINIIYDYIETWLLTISIELNHGANQDAAIYELDCNCKFYWSGGMYCSHMLAVMNNLQVKSIGRFKAFERWTKRI